MENNKAEDPIVELEWSTRRSFYPGLLLLDYLRETQPHSRKTFTEQPSEVFFDQEQEFKILASSLALVVQTHTHGDSVSACTVLQRIEGGVTFVFASNQRSHEECEYLTQEIISILSLLQTSLRSNADAETLRGVRRQILSIILRLAVQRVESYLRALDENLAACKAACERDDTADGVCHCPTLWEAWIELTRNIQLLFSANGSRTCIKEPTRPTFRMWIPEKVRDAILWQPSRVSWTSWPFFGNQRLSA